MKKGNQFYLEVQIFDEENNLLNIQSISKAQFNIGELTKTFDGTNDEVTYDSENQCFKIWLTEQETFGFRNELKIDARVLFVNNTILGTLIIRKYINDSLKEVLLDVETENK